MGRKPVTKKTVEIFSLNVKEKKIYFVGEKIAYTLSDNVVNKCDFEKFKIGKGTTVEVSVNDDNVVSFVKKVKQPKKEEKINIVETSNTTQENTEIWTIKGITPNKTVICFYEAPTKEDGKTKWYNLSEVVKEKIEKDEITAKSKVKVTLEGEEIKNIELIEDKKEENDTVNKSKYVDRNTNTSIEHQVANKGAVQIVQSMIEKDRSDVDSLDKITDVISQLTKSMAMDIAGE